MLDNTLESVIILLVRSSKLHATARSCWSGTPEAGRLHSITALFIIKIHTLGLMCGLTLSIGSSFTCGLICFYRDLSDDGHVVLDDLVVEALPDWHLGGVLFLYQCTFFPGLELTVLITCPHLLSNSIQHPLGVTLLPSHVPTHRHLVVLIQNLEAVADTLLGLEAERVDSVVIKLVHCH